MASHDDWRVAYATQALADLEAWQLLERSNLPECQHLHFLQMACEKLCKAYLCGLRVNSDTLRSSHAYITKHLPRIASEQFARDSRNAECYWVIQTIRVLARKIELLAPAVDDAGRVPANCEYPWVGPDGQVRVPAEHSFGVDLLHEKAGRHLIKVLFTAARELAGKVSN